jgi:sulfatase modifying factor 1
MNNHISYCICIATTLICALPVFAAENAAPAAVANGSATNQTAMKQEQENRLTGELREPFVTVRIEMVPVKGGCFQMGESDYAGVNDEKPIHEVCLSDFSIGKYEVTQRQWRMIMGKNPSIFSSCGDDCPVENVSWGNTQEFILKLNTMTRGSFRLPTEAEWEYAARSGGKHEKYSGGDNVDSVAWYDANSNNMTHPVGQRQPNGLGIFDMSGNVWEWVSDWYDKDYYAESTRKDPKGPSEDFPRVNRGGCWFSGARYVRASYRSDISPEDHLYSQGFRLASQPPAKKQLISW